MTVNSTDKDITYIGNDITVDFGFLFTTHEVAWIVVTLDGIPTTAIEVTIRDDQNDTPGGQVVFDIAPGDGVVIFIERVSDILQRTHYPLHSPFPSRDHEAALDKLTIIAQAQAPDIDSKVNRAGDAMEGALSMAGNPLTNLINGAAPQDAVALSQLDGYVNRSGDSMLGQLSMSGNLITDLPDGVLDSDAANVGQIQPFVIRAEVAAVESESSASDAADSAISANTDADRAEAAAIAGSASVGELKWYFTDHNAPVIRPGLIIPDGQLIDKLGVFNALWLAVELGNQVSVSEAEWQAGQQAAFVDFDANQFRIPRIAGHFIRVPGALDPDARLPGGTQIDAMGPINITDPSHDHPHTIATAAEGAHTHGPGGLSAVAVADHSHPFAFNQEVTGQGGSIGMGSGAGQNKNTGNAGGHGHTITGSTAIGTAHVHTITGAITSAGTGVTAAGAQAATETRPANIYLQPYLVYAAAPSGTGVTLRGAWDADINQVSGDALNSTLTKGVPPTVESLDPNGQGYIVTVAGSFDLTNAPGAETYVIGDRVAWAEDTWIQIKTGEVTSVNLETGDVIIGGDNSPIEVSAPVGPTVKDTTDALDVRVTALEEALALLLN